MGLFLFRSKNEMVYQKFVEVGRVAVLADTGKIAAVVDVINQNRALVEGPGIPRQSMNIKNLYLTKLKVKFNHSAKSSIVKKAWEDAEVLRSSRPPAGDSVSRRPALGLTFQTSRNSR